MRDYFKKTEYVLEQIWFDYFENRYQGRGIMTWKPDEGFHVEALLENQGVPLGKEIELGKVGIIRRSDRGSIRMRPRGFDWAIAPNVTLINHYEILMENRLSIDLSCVIFSESAGISNKDSTRSGSALYETKSQHALSDCLSSELRINEHKVESNSNTSGIWYEDEQNQRIIGRMVDEKHLKLHWGLDKSLWSKAHSWHWPEAAQDALSIWFGENVWLLQREVRRGSQTYIEIRIRRKISSLKHLSLLGETYKLDKNAFVKFTDFFVRNGSHATIARKIFKQMLEAVRQQSWQGTELLVSTILEAALRSIDRHPFQPGDKSWNVEKSLKLFREKYFSREWRPFCEKAIETHRRLRHRNAHPDWLFTQGGYLSDDQKEESLDDLIFVSRFYGYMVLALVGFRDLQPDFPNPHKSWGPTMMIQQLDVNKMADLLAEFSILDE